MTPILSATMSLTTNHSASANAATPQGEPSGSKADPISAVRTVEGPLRSSERDELCGFVEAGGTVVIVPEPGDEVGAGFAGVEVTADLPTTEWFITLADRPERIRLDGEVPITSGLRLLRPTSIADSGGEAVVAATTSVAYEHSPTITLRRLGAGRIIASGITDLGALSRHETVGRFVERLGREMTPAVTRDLGVAVVGYGPFGGMGYSHGLACTETDGLRLSAAVDTSPERLVAATADFPDLACYGDASAAATDDDVDIAIIATPPIHHAELALEFLRAGKHVVVEKPMCITTAQADELIATANANDRMITVHQSRRWDRDFLALRRILERGSIGEAFVIETFVGGFEHPCRAWHSEDSISGGAVYDWGSHHVDWILQLFGSAPSKVLCPTHTRVWLDSTNVDQLALWMQWDDGREATFRQSDVAAIRRPKFYVQGTKGTIEGHYEPMVEHELVAGRGHIETVRHHAEAPVSLSMTVNVPEHGLIASTIPPAPHPGWGFHVNMVDHLVLGERLAVDPKETRDVVRVLEAAHRSGAEGGTLITLDA